MMRAMMRPCPARSRGMTLPEMLVALAIGLAVLLGAGHLLVLANSAYAAQMELAAMDDGGRYALELVARALRQAAATDPDSLLAAGADAAPARIAGLDARSVGRTTPGIEEPSADAVGGSDVLAVRFPGSGPVPDGDGSSVDCAGFTVAGGEEGWSIFHVARNSQGEAELRCKYRGNANWSADAIVAGVDGFQVLYGIDTDEPRDGAPNRYVNADAVRALDAALGTADEQELRRRTWWKRLVSVRIGLLLHGARATRTRPGDADYALLGPAYGESAEAGAADAGSVLREAAMTPDMRLRERRLFTMTVALPAVAP
ncbi:PilW family protein [Massilia sp. YIM B02763]|uniref:PilW family protein n=1 Tax=Massilia sp. YIM B02763 TaxID=3050130 RepID=UPI0025B720AD|nr:PilW family protein [Massilia sp. YIM B02763]MDN4052302.1 PilW family protein [Massilia sp. YIM B02763]